LQRIRTALRASGGRFFYEGEGVEGRDGATEGAADVGRDEVEPDGGRGKRGSFELISRSLLEHLLDVVHPT
jgi:hypothetical protein